MHVQRCSARADYDEFTTSAAFAPRWVLEKHLASRLGWRGSVTVPGVCAPCRRAVDFDATLDGAWQSPDGVLVPNWRDFLRCPSCTMSGRQRMVTQLLDDWTATASDGRPRAAYMMEQLSALFRWATAGAPEVRWTGSEYVGAGHAGGSEVGGLRHEDAERLSFADETFDLVVSCDVLEHMNDPSAALCEVGRVLKPGGTALLTFPMDLSCDRNQRRAEIVDGSVRHLLPAIYHGNPLSSQGSLVFTDFGWEVLGQLRGAGLRDAALYLYWAYELGYLGIQFYFAGHKQ